MFASRHAVAAVTESLPAPPAGVRIAAVGQATAQVLRQRGWPVDLLPDEANAAALVDAFDQRWAIAQGARILFPGQLARAAHHRRRPDPTRRRSGAGRGLSHRVLRALDVDDCRSWIARGGIGAVTFASPSAVDRVGARAGQGRFRPPAVHGGGGRHRPDDRARPHRPRPHASAGRVRDAARACPHHTSIVAERGQLADGTIPLHTDRAGRGSPTPGGAWCARRACRATRSSIRCSSCPGRGVRHAVQSMPGISQLSVDEVVKEAKARPRRACPPFCCLPLPPRRTRKASSALDPQGSRRAGDRRHQGRLSRSCWCGRTYACAAPPTTGTAATCCLERRDRQ